MVHCCQVDNNTVNDEEISSVEEDGADVWPEDEEEGVAPTIPAANSSKLKKRGVTAKKLHQDQLQSEVANRNEIQSIWLKVTTICKCKKAVWAIRRL